jgi:hypothetical protein
LSRHSEEELQFAIANARLALGLSVSQPARVWDVARAKPGAAGFLLVVFGSPQRSCGLATVDPQTGNVLESARLPGVASHNVMSPEEAVERAKFPAGSPTQLVWEPSKASRSPFYPLWQIHNAGRTVWVDGIRGDVWETLSPSNGRRGGGGLTPPSQA